MYGLELLKETDFLNELECHDIYSDATSLIKLITSIIKPPLLLGQKKTAANREAFLNRSRLPGWNLLILDSRFANCKSFRMFELSNVPLNEET